VPTDAPFSEEKWPQPAKNKAAMIARLDGYIGQLTEQLQKLGMTNNAAVFFTSATFPQKTGAVDPNFFHSIVSSNDVRVPMIVHWPAGFPPEQSAISNGRRRIFCRRRRKSGSRNHRRASMALRFYRAAGADQKIKSFCTGGNRRVEIALPLDLLTAKLTHTTASTMPSTTAASTKPWPFVAARIFVVLAHPQPS